MLAHIDQPRAETGSCNGLSSGSSSQLKLLRERRQLRFATLNGNLAVSGWVGLAYDR